MAVIIAHSKVSKFHIQDQNFLNPIQYQTFVLLTIAMLNWVVAASVLGAWLSLLILPTVSGSLTSSSLIDVINSAV